MLSRRVLTGIAVVVDVALLARGQPVAARTLAERQGRPTRHLESLLQDLVRSGLLKGTRGPRGGYELARERRRINLADIVRSLGPDPSPAEAATPSRLIEDVVRPALGAAEAAYLDALGRVSIQDLTAAAEDQPAVAVGVSAAEFHI